MTTKTKGGKKVTKNNKIDFDKVNEYAKELGIAAKGKKKDEFINEVLDAIVSQYTEYEEKMDEKDFETYKKESQEMLQFYMDNKDYGQEVSATVKKDEKVEAEEPITEAEEEKEPETTKEPEAEEKVGEKTIAEEKEKPSKGEWTPGSSAQICFEILKAAGKKGLTIGGGIEKAEGKFETLNLPARVAAVFKAAVTRGLAKKTGDKFIATI